MTDMSVSYVVFYTLLVINGDVCMPLTLLDILLPVPAVHTIVRCYLCEHPPCACGDEPRRLAAMDVVIGRGFVLRSVTGPHIRGYKEDMRRSERTGKCCWYINVNLYNQSIRV